MRSVNKTDPAPERSPGPYDLYSAVPFTMVSGVAGVVSSSTFNPTVYGRTDGNVTVAPIVTGTRRSGPSSIYIVTSDLSGHCDSMLKVTSVYPRGGSAVVTIVYRTPPSHLSVAGQNP